MKGKKIRVRGEYIDPQRYVTPVKFPDLEVQIPDTESQQAPPVLSHDEEAPKISEYAQKEEEDVGTRMDTVEEFMGVQSGQRKIVQQAKYPENIQTKWIGPKNAWNPVSNGLVNSIYLIVLILDYARWNQTRNRLAPLRDPPLISHKEKSVNLRKIIKEKETFPKVRSAIMGKAIYNNSTFTFNPKYLKIGHDNSSQEMSMGKRSDTYLEKSQLETETQKAKPLNGKLLQQPDNLGVNIIPPCQRKPIDLLIPANVLDDDDKCELCKRFSSFVMPLKFCADCFQLADRAFTNKTKRRNILLCLKGIVLLLFLLLLAAIAYIVYTTIKVKYFDANSNEELDILKEKYELAITALNTTKDYISEQQFQILNLNLALDACQKERYKYGEKLNAYEESMLNLKKYMTRTNFRTIYKEIVNQIANWVKIGLLRNSSPVGRFNVPMTDSQFSPANDAIIEKKIIKEDFNLLLEKYGSLKSKCTTFQSIISNLETNAINRKNEILVKQSSSESFYSLEWYRSQALNSPIPLQFYVITQNTGISLWTYEEKSEIYNQISMHSGQYGRGEVNENGIYVVGGGNNSVMVYDMKYYNHPDKKLQLLDEASHSNTIPECFLKDSLSAICCDWDGFLKEYDLTNPHSITPTTIFYKEGTTFNSCMLTKDKKYIIAGSTNMLYILDAGDGTLRTIHKYPDNRGSVVSQIGEVRENVLITVDVASTSIHDLRDIEKIPLSIDIFPDVGLHFTVLALKKNKGDFATGGRSSSAQLGFVRIQHLGEDIQTLTLLDYIDDIPGNGCFISIISELKIGTIFYGGVNGCTQICSWNYSANPKKDPLCYDLLQQFYVTGILGLLY